MAEVVRVEKTAGFSVMSNYHLRDMGISLKAKGLLTQMLSLPPNWDYTISGLAHINMEKEDAIRSAIKELINAGYVSRKRRRDSLGRLSISEYTIFEMPQANQTSTDKPTPEQPIQEHPTMEKPMLENPILEIPSLDLPTQENPVQLNKEKENKEKINTDSNKYRSINLDGSIDGIDEIYDRNWYRKFLQENIELYAFEHDRSYDVDRINGILEMVLDVICSTNETIKLNGAPVAHAVVKSRFLKLEHKHIEYVLDCLDANPSNISNPRAYILTTLFNAPNTIDQYYTSLVNYHSSGKEPSCKKK